MNAQVGKIIFAAALGFVSGAALSAFVTYKLAYNAIEEREIARFDEEIAKARAKIAKNSGETNDTKETKPDTPVDIKDEGHAYPNNDEEGEHEIPAVAFTNDYRRYFQNYGSKKDTEPVTHERVVESRVSKPMFVDDYESLVAIVPKGEAQIYEWTFYSNFRGGIVVDIATEMVMNYERLFGMGSKELRRTFGQSDTIYIYLPGDSMGVILGLDPDVSPELLELDIPPTMYPSPSEEDDEEDEDNYDEPEWGDS